MYIKNLSEREKGIRRRARKVENCDDHTLKQPHLQLYLLKRGFVMGILVAACRFLFGGSGRQVTLVRIVHCNQLCKNI